MDTNNSKVPSYKEGLVAVREFMEERIPAENLERYDNYALKLGSAFGEVLKVGAGDIAPSFALLNAQGTKRTLTELLEAGKVVLVFYRGAWCPYCNLQLKQYQQILPRIKEKGAQLVAISPQNPDGSLSTIEKNALDFEVLSDPGCITAHRYTAVFRNMEVPDVTDQSFKEHEKNLPVPAVFVIDKRGTITYAKEVGGDYRYRVEPQAILETL